MNARFDPLTARYKRNLHEMEPDARRWWTTAEAAIAEEEFIRDSFNDDARPRQTTSWPLRAAYVFGLCAFVVLALKFFKR